MQEKPSFSVVTPVYNAEAYLSQTIESVLAQSFADFEYILVNDGSTDGSRDIIESYVAKDSRVRAIHRREKSGGPATPRNRGILESRGDYVALLDADDIWEKDKLKNDAAFLDRNPVDILFSGAKYFRETTNSVFHISQPRELGPRFLISNYVPLLTVCIKKEILGPSKLLFDTDPGMVAIEDYNLLLRAYLQGKRIACRKGTDALYRSNAATSLYSRGGFDALIRRIVHNYAKIAGENSFSWHRLYFLITASTVFHYIKRIMGRL